MLPTLGLGLSPGSGPGAWAHDWATVPPGRERRTMGDHEYFILSKAGARNLGGSGCC